MHCPCDKPRLATLDEEPIAFYPDATGHMFSGSVVVDSTNSSGLFKSPEGGLVAIITSNGNGQRIEIAYSEDEGRTWQKYDKVVADWSQDPLQNQDFRDPKVFRWNNQCLWSLQVVHSAFILHKT